MKRFLFLFMFSACFQGPVAADIEKLREGEVLVLESESDLPGGKVRVQALARASAQAVWEVIVSCEKTFFYVDGLQSCDVIEDSGQRALLHQVTQQGWPAPTLDFIYESLREPYRAIRFKLVQGNLQAMEGSWQFIETPDGLLMDYEIRIKPEMAAPDFLVSRSLRKSSPDMVACIRGLSGGSGSARLETSDLGRCREQAGSGQ